MQKDKDKKAPSDLGDIFSSQPRNPERKKRALKNPKSIIAALPEKMKGSVSLGVDGIKARASASNAMNTEAARVIGLLVDALRFLVRKSKNMLPKDKIIIEKRIQSGLAVKKYYEDTVRNQDQDQG